MTFEQQIEKLGFNENQSNELILSKYILSKIMSVKNIENTLFNTMEPMSLDKSWKESSDAYELNATKEQRQNVINAFFDAGFIDYDLKFWETGDIDHIYTNIDNEERDELLAELKKSQDAANKYALDDWKEASSLSIAHYFFASHKEYEKYLSECGNVYNPETGDDGFDPLFRLVKRYYFTDAIIRDPAHVIFDSEDLCKAQEILIPEPLKEEIKALAAELAIERLKKI